MKVKEPINDLLARALTLDDMLLEIDTISGYHFKATTDDCYIIEPLLYLNKATIAGGRLNAAKVESFIIDLTDIKTFRIKSKELLQ